MSHKKCKHYNIKSNKRWYLFKHKKKHFEIAKMHKLPFQPNVSTIKHIIFNIIYIFHIDHKSFKAMMTNQHRL